MYAGAGILESTGDEMADIRDLFDAADTLVEYLAPEADDPFPKVTSKTIRETLKPASDYRDGGIR